MNTMNKRVPLVELLFKKPCKKCLIQACCSKECDKLNNWYRKYNTLIEINHIILLVGAIVYMLFLGILGTIRIIKMEVALLYMDKIEKYIEKNIR